MNNKPLALLVLGAVISTSSFSASFLQKVLPSSKNQNTKMTLTKSEPTREGTNFSGTWVGSCTGNDWESTLTIENSDYSIELDGNHYDINSMVSEGSAHPNWYDNTQLRFVWNSTKTVLLVNGIGIDNHSSDPSFNTDIFEMSFSLKDDQLITKAKIKTFQNSKLVESFPYTCTFKRQG